MDAKDRLIASLKEELDVEKQVKNSEVILNKDRILSVKEKDVALELLSNLNDKLIKENARLRQIIEDILKIK